MVVFPSNATLADRAHGMAESTMRRHLAALTAAGLLMRHDSPNGKRYAVRGPDGEIERAFGLDLRPLLIRAAAAETRAATRRMKAARERASLHLRDLEKHVLFAMDLGRDREGQLYLRLADFKRRWRRKLAFDDVQQLSAEVSAMLAEVIHMIDAQNTEEMNGNDNRYEQHYQNSKPEHSDSEPCLEKQEGRDQHDDRDVVRGDEVGEGRGRRQVETEPGQGVTISLGLVMAACREISLYADGEIRSWRDLCATAAFVRGMLGISADAWEEAERRMGAETAAITIACILERTEAIRSPGGYLRALSLKAEEGAFSPGPMVMAILNTRETVAA